MEILLRKFTTSGFSDTSLLSKSYDSIVSSFLTSSEDFILLPKSVLIAYSSITCCYTSLNNIGHPSLENNLRNKPARTIKIN